MLTPEEKAENEMKKVDESKTEQFRFYLEFDNDELQEILHKMEQSLDTFVDCVYQLERLGIAKVKRKDRQC